MVVFEALNALYGDCLILRYPDAEGVERIWVVDGGPRVETVAGTPLSVWKDVLLPRLRSLSASRPVPIALGVISHIDDDHINGLQRLLEIVAAASAGAPAPVRFQRFWFNSFARLVRGVPGDGSVVASLQDVARSAEAESDAVVQSVAQGEGVSSLLVKLGLADNAPVHGLVRAATGQRPIDVDGAKVTVVGPLAKRVERLKKTWEAATAKSREAEGTAALQELFPPEDTLDTSVPNLSSIVLLVEVGARRLLLAADAQGADIVSAWADLGLGDAPVRLDVLKMPHHGSIRNTPKAFLETFEADHYVFSANGKYRNPDPEVVEATIKIHGHRAITLHFTNRQVAWDPPYILEKGGATVRGLEEMSAALKDAYGGLWEVAFRADGAPSLEIALP